MRTPHLLLGVALIAAWLLAACAPGHPYAGRAGALRVPWTYAGERGPDAWATIDPLFAPCGEGRRQSPIDLSGGTPLPLPDLGFEYRASRRRIRDVGHAVEVEGDGRSTLMIPGAGGGERWRLRRIQFRVPSEHAIDGRRFAMEAHLVHQNRAGDLAVVAVLLDEGPPSLPLAGVCYNLPRRTRSGHRDAVHLDPADLLPEDRAYFAYDGSLTMPPCTEGVSWFVLRTPVTLSGDQLAAFQRIHDGNARPLQPRHGRVVRRRAARGE